MADEKTKRTDDLEKQDATEGNVPHQAGGGGGDGGGKITPPPQDGGGD